MAKLNQTPFDDLNKIGVPQHVINRINNNDFLVNQINTFYKNGGKFVASNIGTFRLGKEIHLSSGYKEYHVIAHEIGHAQDKKQAGPASLYNSAQEYAEKRGIGEAEAIYNEFEAIEHEKKQNNGQSVDEVMSGNLYKAIVSLNGDQKKIERFLADVNMFDMRPNISFASLNYYESDVWYYLAGSLN